VAQSRYYAAHTAGFRAELAAAVPRETLRDLHRREPARHAAVAVRQFAILALGLYGLVTLTHPILWVPVAAVEGFTVFNFTILLHEVAHCAVFRSRRPRLERALGLAYAIPSGISASQFTRWHLDHHAGLGSPEDDPKRHHLSPKINARWLKALYLTPALFPIYFRAARREAATYEPALQRAIAIERWVSIACHVAVLGSLAWFAGWGAAVRAYVIPVFFVFPVAFTLNRLGQHYSIDPGDPAGWTTLMRGHWFWDFAFLNSNYHLEHHYFPSVPFYRLPELQRLLTPYFERKGLAWRTYGNLLRGWFITNKAPHTKWDGSEDGSQS
jgi:fatty acid desaturase